MEETGTEPESESDSAETLMEETGMEPESEKNSAEEPEILPQPEVTEEILTESIPENTEEETETLSQSSCENESIAEATEYEQENKESLPEEETDAETEPLSEIFIFDENGVCYVTDDMVISSQMVVLYDVVIISGATCTVPADVTLTNEGHIRVENGGRLVVAEGGTVENGGGIAVADNSYFELYGTLNNNKQVSVEGTGTMIVYKTGYVANKSAIQSVPSSAYVNNTHIYVYGTIKNSKDLIISANFELAAGAVITNTVNGKLNTGEFSTFVSYGKITNSGSVYFNGNIYLGGSSTFNNKKEVFVYYGTLTRDEGCTYLGEEPVYTDPQMEIDPEEDKRGTTSVNIDGLTLLVTFDDYIECKKETTFKLHTEGGVGPYEYGIVTIKDVNNIFEGNTFYPGFSIEQGCEEWSYTFCTPGMYYINMYVKDLGTGQYITTGKYKIAFKVYETLSQINNGHEWYYDESVSTRATCTSDGFEVYHCRNCTVENSRFVPMMGHNIVTDFPVAPTCTNTGSTWGSHCSNCNMVVMETQSIPETGHSWGLETIVSRQSCLTPGIKTCTCRRCGVSKIEIMSAEHVVITDPSVAAGCTTTGKSQGSHCAVCGKVLIAQRIIPATGHRWNSGVVIKRPTSSIPGIIKCTCSKCKAISTKAIY